ncbi:MAG TPA: type I phosphomannose isomerase catalytic subunit [Bacteroidaceae bacterium]|nr:type I phosphomannose isomerase catalytic subunit [Bacteroidaceae bacterium]
MIYTFKTYYKQILWGGQKIKLYKKGLFPPSEKESKLALDFNKPTTELEDNRDFNKPIGESWEISALPGFESVVDYGPSIGATLKELIESQREKLVGENNYNRFGNEFPLLIKFIDAQKDLSVQVHPDDKWAVAHSYPSGKSEMWYVVHAEPDTTIYSGFNRTITHKELREHIERESLLSVLAQHKLKAGDTFFLPAGRIHSIGAGALICEIQQSCDLTFRVYDFKRCDSNGNERKLHIDQALQVIDFNLPDNYRTLYKEKRNSPVALTQTPEFKTNLYHIDHTLNIDYSKLDSFVILVCIQGKGDILDNTGCLRRFSQGLTFLIPASTSQIILKPLEESRFLEVFIDP